MGIRLEFDVSRIAAERKRRCDRAQKVLAIQVLADSNFFCPEDTGFLQTSAVIASKGDEIVWDAEYAKKQYYTDDNKSKDRNPNARSHWFEHAKTQNKDAWEKLANREFNK